MEAVAQRVQPKIGPNQSFIVGRIDAVNQFNRSGEKVFQARVIQPAVDQFSSPGKVLLESSSMIGRVGDDVQVLCQVTGFGRFYKKKETDERVDTADMVLKVIG